MNDEEMLEAIEKLRYQVSILGQTIDVDAYPVEGLILERDWGPSELDKAHDIFENWDNRLEAGEEMNTGEFEQEFAQSLGVSYQGLKGVIRAFYKNGQWTNVCEAYVDSFGGFPAVEYHSIMRRER